MSCAPYVTIWDMEKDFLDHGYDFKAIMRTADFKSLMLEYVACGRQRVSNRRFNLSVHSKVTQKEKERFFAQHKNELKKFKLR